MQNNEDISENDEISYAGIYNAKYFKEVAE